MTKTFTDKFLSNIKSFLVFMLLGALGYIALIILGTNFEFLDWLFGSSIVLGFISLLNLGMSFIPVKRMLSHSIVPFLSLFFSTILLTGEDTMGYGLEAVYTLSFLINPIFSLLIDIGTSLQTEIRMIFIDIILTVFISLYIFLVLHFSDNDSLKRLESE
ncbi:hypothetical protein A8B79_05360 [Balneola sp. EhC07]|uniref:hypothetical protein n=1 Tax=Balneola sp. EhC07 TaxID=1849360 RepID=UPI0007F52E83|nr:hypothetical protein [Balneola sp. EhC07]OAN61850.1 hypothetical protein A8B79_05360 [Balneola sp. EhC07]